MRTACTMYLNGWAYLLPAAMKLWPRLCFYSCLWFCLQGGVSEADPPGSRHPPQQTPPWSRHCPHPQQTPPGVDTPQVRPPPEQTPPGLSTPSQTKYTPPGSRLRHTVNERLVRILLECVLVVVDFSEKVDAVEPPGCSKIFDIEREVTSQWNGECNSHKRWTTHTFWPYKEGGRPMRFHCICTGYTVKNLVDYFVVHFIQRFSGRSPPSVLLLCCSDNPLQVPQPVTKIVSLHDNHFRTPIATVVTLGSIKCIIVTYITLLHWTFPVWYSPNLANKLSQLVGDSDLTTLATQWRSGWINAL